jgi:hypothetical protein
MKLSKATFELYASKHYQASNWATTEDFKSDLARFKYINRLIKRYYRDDDLKERLILNHITILGNMFGPLETALMLMYNTDCPLKSVSKTFLVYLNYLPESEYVEIPLDSTIVNALREL